MIRDFNQYKDDEYVIDGHKIQTYEDCKDWLMLQWGQVSWERFVHQCWPYEMVRRYEREALDLHLHLFKRNFLR